MCRGWEPIWLSRKDVVTQGTKEQIAGNNAAREAWCGTPQKPAQIAAKSDMIATDITP